MTEEKKFKSGLKKEEENYIWMPNYCCYCHICFAGTGQKLHGHQIGGKRLNLILCGIRQKEWNQAGLFKARFSYSVTQGKREF